MKYKILFSAIILATAFSSCTNDSVDDLIGDTVITGEVKYTQNVKSIMDNNCNSCHGAVPTNGAPMPLVTYAQVKDAYENRGLLNRMQRQNGDGLLMPQGGPRLPQSTIDVIIQWNADGLQE